MLGWGWEHQGCGGLSPSRGWAMETEDLHTSLLPSPPCLEVSVGVLGSGCSGLLSAAEGAAAVAHRRGLSFPARQLPLLERCPAPGPAAAGNLRQLCRGRHELPVWTVKGRLEGEGAQRRSWLPGGDIPVGAEDPRVPVSTRDVCVCWLSTAVKQPRSRQRFRAVNLRCRWPRCCRGCGRDPATSEGISRREEPPAFLAGNSTLCTEQAVPGERFPRSRISRGPQRTFETGPGT